MIEARQTRLAPPTGTGSPGAKGDAAEGYSQFLRTVCLGRRRISAGLSQETVKRYYGLNGLIFSFFIFRFFHGSSFSFSAVSSENISRNGKSRIL